MLHNDPSLKEKIILRINLSGAFLMIVIVKLENIRCSYCQRAMSNRFIIFIYEFKNIKLGKIYEIFDKITLLFLSV